MIWMLVAAPFIIMMVWANAESNIIYVTQSGGGEHDGSSWTNSYSAASLDHAVSTAGASATAHKQIWVEKGVYNLTRTLTLPIGVKIYGGFTSGDTTLESRDIDP